MATILVGSAESRPAGVQVAGQRAVNSGMDAELGPIESVSPGMAVTVMPRGEWGVAYGQGVLQSSRGFSVYISTTECPWQPGDEVVLACGALGRRAAALARFREHTGGQAIFSRQSPWRPFNRRSLERYATSLAATLGLPEPVIDVTVTDISMGGAAVLVAETPPGARMWLRMATPAGECAVPVAIVGGHGDEAGTILHLRFEDVTPEAALVLRGFVSGLASALASEAA